MVISPLKFTRSADLRGPFGRVKVKDAFHLDALTIKLHILYSILSYQKAERCLEGKRVARHNRLQPTGGDRC